MTTLTAEEQGVLKGLLAKLVASEDATAQRQARKAVKNETRAAYLESCKRHGVLPVGESFFNRRFPGDPEPDFATLQNAQVVDLATDGSASLTSVLAEAKRDRV